MKARAVTEVVVVSALIWLVVVLVGLSPLSEWERQTPGPYNFIEHSLIIALTLLVLVITRKSLAYCGISFRNLRYHLDIAVTAFLPVALGYLPIAFICSLVQGFVREKTGSIVAPSILHGLPQARSAAFGF